MNTPFKALENPQSVICDYVLTAIGVSPVLDGRGLRSPTLAQKDEQGWGIRQRSGRRL
jgi:hypothetical protein